MRQQPKQDCDGLYYVRRQHLVVGVSLFVWFGQCSALHLALVWRGSLAAFGVLLLIPFPYIVSQGITEIKLGFGIHSRLFSVCSAFLSISARRRLSGSLARFTGWLTEQLSMTRHQTRSHEME